VRIALCAGLSLARFSALAVRASALAVQASALAAQAVVVMGCSSSGTLPTASADGGDDSSPLTIQPAMASCEDSNCISGTASIDGFSAMWKDPNHPGSWSVSLYDNYPSGDAKPFGSPQYVASDAGSAVEGVWAFNGLDGGSHYYVRAAVVFGGLAGDGGSVLAVTAVVGPLAVGASNVPVVVRPLQATVLESQLVGGTMQLDWVLAHLFDPSTGAPLTDASVSVLVGDASVSMPPVPPGGTLGPAYLVQFAQPPAAQPTYVVTANGAAFDGGISATLVASTHTFDAAPPAVDAGRDGLAVSWQADPQSDYEVVDLFAAAGDGGWVSTPVFTSPRSLPPDQTSEQIPALDAGSYLVNVSYTNANCLPDAGCVQAATVGATTLTVN
jgi:hypothetical protein